MARKQGLNFYYDWVSPLSKIPEKDFKPFILAMVAYDQEAIAEVPQFNSVEAQMASDFVFPQIRRAKQLIENGRKGGATTQRAIGSTIGSTNGSSTITNTNTNTYTETITSTRDIPPAPTLEVIKEYNANENITSYAEAERFFNYYAAKGWQISGDPVIDWKALLRNWATNNFSEREKGDSPSAQSFDVDEFFAHAMERSYGKK